MAWVKVGKEKSYRMEEIDMFEDAKLKNSYHNEILDTAIT